MDDRTRRDVERLESLVVAMEEGGLAGEELVAALRRVAEIAAGAADRLEARA